MSRTKTSGLNDSAPRIAVLIPCHNEEPTVGEVVNAFRAELPTARIYVFDNNSSVSTEEAARAAGAIVMREPRQGKGFVVQSMFRRVDADVYIMVDGDGVLLMLVALVPGLLAVFESISKGAAVRLPLAVLATGLALCGLLSLTVGLILHSIARRSQNLEYQLEMLADELRGDPRADVEAQGMEAARR